MLSFICLVTTILASALSVEANGLNHIVGGTLAHRCEFPHIVFVYTTKDGKHFGCGGSIVDKNHIVTAAHCMAGNVEKVDVLLGSLDKRTMPVWKTVSRFSKHKGFASLRTTVVNDVAVLTLSTPIRFTSCIKPIRMAAPGEKFVGDCTIAGWGRTGNTLPTSEVLLRADIPIMDKAVCKKRLATIFDQHICGGGGMFFGKTTCKGDSGGPLMCTSANDGQRVLAGIVSYGWKCNTGLAIFTKVSYYLPWIKAAMNNMP